MSTLKKGIFFFLTALNMNAYAIEQPSKTEVNVKQTPISQEMSSDVTLEKMWGLTTEEVKRFDEILRSPRNYFTPKLQSNPILALGLESRSEAERNQFADKWVRIQFDNNVKVIKWSLAVDEAWKRNYPNTPRFVLGITGKEHLAISNKARVNAIGKLFNQGKNLNLERIRKKIWLKIHNCQQCDHEFNRLIDDLRLGRISGIDVFVEGNVEQKDIVDWAVKNKIPSQYVEQKMVTLNFARNHRYLKKTSEVPHVE